jgi:sugar/nucleoside kinase (ribokinase family)
MTIDVACVGSPFLDLIFRGLKALPGPGEEQVARDLVIVPGAIANVAYALNRLGLEAVVCAPVGRDPAGRLLGELMADAGVRWIGRSAPTTPVSVAMPVDGDRSFVTAGPPPTVDTDALAALEPRAVVVDLPSIGLLPPLPIVYAVVGDPEVNDREARGMTGVGDTDGAAAHLARLGATVVVTCGRSGALATEPHGRVVRVEAPIVEVDDPTGAGDLFTAAYVWADLAGRSLEDRLALASAYASLSLAGASSRQKGLTHDEFQHALTERDQSHLGVEEA